jgi:hypothetical protein
MLSLISLRDDLKALILFTIVRILRFSPVIAANDRPRRVRRPTELRRSPV